MRGAPVAAAPVAEPIVAIAGAGIAPEPVAPAPAPVPAPAPPPRPPRDPAIEQLAKDIEGHLYSIDFLPSGAVEEKMDGTSTFLLEGGVRLDEYIASNSFATQPILGYGLSGNTYKITVNGKSYVLKYISNVPRVSRVTILYELRFLQMVHGKPWAVQLLAAQIMPDGTAFMLFPYIAGRDLFDVIIKHQDGTRPVDDATFRNIYEAILTALLELHDMGIIHRDIKPENIYVPDVGPPFLLDFGLSGLTEETLRTAGTRDYIRSTRIGQNRKPTPNNNFYALGKTADYIGPLRAVAARLMAEGLTDAIVRSNRAFHFRGGKRTRRRRHGRKQRGKTRKY